MKLIDFSKSSEFINLLNQMGIKEISPLPPVEFKRKISKTVTKEKNNPDYKLKKELEKKIIDVSATDITSDSKGLLTYKGRKVAAYIRDQSWGVDTYNKTTGYKYHLCFCKTIEQMRNAGREKRYFITQRSDGKFPIRYISDFSEKKIDISMELCKNCKAKLLKRRMYPNLFTLKKFFEKYDSSVPETIRYEETVTQTQDYTPDHKEVASKYKEAAKYKCQSCNVDCSSNHRLLHLHHKNGDKSDNSHENLRVLCVECHACQPYHSQIRNNPEFNYDIMKVKKLQKEQGITLNN